MHATNSAAIFIFTRVVRRVMNVRDVGVDKYPYRWWRLIVATTASARNALLLLLLAIHGTFILRDSTTPSVSLSADFHAVYWVHLVQLFWEIPYNAFNTITVKLNQFDVPVKF